MDQFDDDVDRAFTRLMQLTTEARRLVDGLEVSSGGASAARNEIASHLEELRGAIQVARLLSAERRSHVHGRQAADTQSHPMADASASAEPSRPEEVHQAPRGSRINIREESECRCWSRKLGVRPKELKRAVREVGDRSDDVERYFELHRPQMPIGVPDMGTVD
jgi:hypothetical protein